MKDLALVFMAALVVISYLIYMVCGPGGDGVIFGSVLGAVCLLAGVKYERGKNEPLHDMDTNEYQVL